MHGDKLMSNEIIARSQGCRNSSSPVERVQDGVASPFSSVLCTRNKTLLVDLKPYFTRAIPVVAAGAWALGHVDEYGSGPVRPLCPVRFELIACSDGSCQAGTEGAGVVAADVRSLCGSVLVFECLRK